MNKTEGEMKQLVEASGGCWHENTKIHATDDSSYFCEHCNRFVKHGVNPSPNDLNTLFDIAEKLGFADVEMAWTFTEYQVLIASTEEFYVYTGQTRGDALRTVLIKSLEGNNRGENNKSRRMFHPR